MADMGRLQEVLDRVMTMCDARMRRYRLPMLDAPDSSRATLQACLQRVPSVLQRLSDGLDDASSLRLMDEIFCKLYAFTVTDHPNTRGNRSRGTDGNEALHYAVANKNILCTLVFLACGADANCRDIASATPMFQAVLTDDDEIFELLVAFGADVRIKAKDSLSLLHCAAIRGSIKCAKILLSMIAKTFKTYKVPEYRHRRGRGDHYCALGINVLDATGCTPLYKATEGGHSKLVRLFLDSGADCDIGNEDKVTPLMHAIPSNNESIAMILLEACGNVNIRGFESKTALFHAVSMKQTHIVKALLQCPACDCNITTYEKVSPLHIAMQDEMDNPAIVALLMKNGASLTIKNSSGETPLHLAVSRGSYRCAGQLLSNDENNREILERGDALSCTPLHVAAGKGNLRLLQLLLKKGACIEARNQNNMTAFHMAVDRLNITTGKIDCAKELLKAGADPNCSHEIGAPLHFAATFGDNAMIEVLLDHGANINTEAGILGFTPFRLALGQFPDTAHLLIRRGASLQGKQRQLRSMHFRVAVSTPGLLKDMVTAGMDCNFLDMHGYTPLHLATDYSDYQTVLMLLTSGANPNMMNNEGAAPLAYSLRPDKTRPSPCMRWGQEEASVWKALIQYGARVDDELPAKCTHFTTLTILEDAVVQGNVALVDVLLCIQDGGSVRMADWLDDDENKAIHTIFRKSPPRLDALKYICKQPRSLKSLCRKEIRETILETPQQDEKFDFTLIAMKELPLTRPLLDYLFMNEFNECPHHELVVPSDVFTAVEYCERVCVL